MKPSSFAGSSNGHPACRVSSSAGESGRCHVTLGLGRRAAPNHALHLQVSQVYPIVVTPLSRKISVNDFTVQLLKDFVESPDDVDAIKNILTKIRITPQYRQMNAHRQYTSVRHKKNMAAVKSLPDLVTIVKAEGGLTWYTYYFHTLPKRSIKQPQAYIAKQN